MEFDIKKCDIMEFGKSKNRTSGQYKPGEKEIRKKEFEKDLGVFITKDVSPDKQVNKSVGETYSV